MFKLEIYVKLKSNVLDPQGKAIEQAAKSINIKNITEVKQGKYFEILVDKELSKEKIVLIGNQLSKKLLCNEVIEDYKIIKIKKI